MDEQKTEISAHRLHLVTASATYLFYAGRQPVNHIFEVIEGTAGVLRLHQGAGRFEVHPL